MRTKKAAQPAAPSVPEAGQATATSEVPKSVPLSDLQKRIADELADMLTHGGRTEITDMMVTAAVYHHWYRFAMLTERDEAAISEFTERPASGDLN